MTIPILIEKQEGFAGGINDSNDPLDLAKNEVANARNFSFSYPPWARQRFGSKKVNTYPIDAVYGKGLAQLADIAEETKLLIVYGSDNKVYRYDSSTGYFVEMKELTAGNYWDYEVYQGKLFVVNGSDDMHKIYGTTILPCGMDRPNKPTCSEYVEGSNLSGTYDFKVVDVYDEEGVITRSAASEASDPIKVVNKGITVSVGTKPAEVSRRELYGKGGVINAYRLIGEIEDVGYVGATEILRPNSNGDNNEFPTQYPSYGLHYDKVDEEVCDNNDTYLESSDTAAQLELFNLPATSIPADAKINYVRVYVRSRFNGIEFIRVSLKTGGSLFNSDLKGANTYPNYAEVSNTWIINPKTGVAWTKADIDALQIGFKNRAYWTIRVSQIHVFINYQKQTDATSFNVNTNESTWKDRLKIHGDKPPSGAVSVALRNDRIYLLKDDMIYVSDLEFPESFRLYTYIPINVDDGDVGEKIIVLDRYLFIFKRQNIYMLGGYASDEPLDVTLNFIRLNAPCGTMSPKTVVDCGGYIIFLGTDKKIYRLQSNGTISCISEQRDIDGKLTKGVRNFLDSINDAYINKACAMYFSERTEYRLWVPTGSNSHNDSWLAYNTVLNNFAIHDNIIAGDSIMALNETDGMCCYVVDGNSVSPSLKVYELDDEDLYTDNNISMTAYLETKKFDGDSRGSKKNFRKLWAKILDIPGGSCDIYYRRDGVPDWSFHASVSLNSPEDDVKLTRNIMPHAQCCQYKLSHSSNSARMTLKELRVGSQIRGLLR